MFHKLRRLVAILAVNDGLKLVLEDEGAHVDQYTQRDGVGLSRSYKDEVVGCASKWLKDNRLKGDHGYELSDDELEVIMQEVNKIVTLEIDDDLDD
jgi:hypothetical protein